MAFVFRQTNSRHRGPSLNNLRMSRAIGLGFVVCLTMLAPISVKAAKSKTYRFGAWRVEMTHDSFTGRNACHMKGDHLEYADHVVSFKFNATTQTDQAIFRVNGSAPQAASAFQNDVRSRVLFYDPGPIDNLGGGKVRLPETLLAEASYFDIRPNPKARVRHFKVDGFNAAVAFMQERDCSVTSKT